MSDAAAIDPELCRTARAWPFEEARKLITRTGGRCPDKGYVLFQTGYGPSGLPHTGTFGEVLRTSMVRRAFEAMTGGEIPTRLICFSDDMDGFRKVPSNVPNQEMLAEHLNKPLCRVPDPFGEDESFSAHNNRLLRQFLDSFGFDYEFISAADYYTGGRFDDALLRVLEKFDEVMAIMLPTLGPDRRATYSPFLPVSPASGEVLQVPTLARDVAAGTITFLDTDGVEKTVPVTGGHVKLQWKPDWALRKYALGVDYEMSGKDLIDSDKLSARIVKVLGGRAPEGFNYELFLDEKGQKISKSKGNGLSMDEWLSYAPPESLAQFMYVKPRTAKRLYFDVIPKSVDEYLTFAGKLENEPAEKQIENPAWHIQGAMGGKAATGSETFGLSFALLLNLVSAANASDKDILWGFIQKYAPEASPETAPVLDGLAGYAVRYYQDFVKPAKVYRDATDAEAAALRDLATRLDGVKGSTDAEEIQTLVFAVGKDHGFEPLRTWFQTLYQVLLGQDQGPRFGSFTALYGTENVQQLIAERVG